ncbi:hypothetical protein [Branchiibius sp. NY16-3462-2]|uniref:hypothetical protein n=1 Tax=Branchiibius sp. NY16-3462-2 TaxID=1807500 RepID=UPI000792436E|nr:hypothetical protein [Branchiibius sp. NY16-3462-2]KYH45027.1 hypothetical protein AZH51_14145 [Branchiibius sp. NY16-3462-2]
MNETKAALVTHERRPEVADLPVTRRTLAKGAAWTTPVLLVGAVTPPASASVQPGLQGWVTVGKSCDSNTMTLTIDGTGSYPDRGLWVYGPSTQNIANAFITFYYPSTLAITWAANPTNASWSVPAIDNTAPAISGFTAYTTKYSGAWTYHPTGADGPYSTANGQPNFTGTAQNAGVLCRNGVNVYARRTVTVNGTQVTFLRGPVQI